MSKRIYEIAKELSLDTKEVMGRLQDDGMEIKNHFQTVDDETYERLFTGGDSNGSAASEEETVHQAVKPDTTQAKAAGNGRTEAQQKEAEKAQKAEREGKREESPNE
ncbi:MAG: translation initiation factor IF-2 N-terminal domain-containing protein, partial [Rubrobacter sp.]|nr:translation initiation factor IF-2 N-terminal domain-containing protein [Rubrobacter sp.]